MKDLDCFISQRFWIKDELVSDEIIQAYTLKLFDEAKCKPQCGYFEDRPCAGCDSCPCYLGTLKLYKTKEINGIKYLGFPANNPVTIKKLFRREYWGIKNLRKKIPFSQKDLKFTGKLRQGEYVDGVKSVNQKQICDDWLQKKIGIIESPARSGKTVIGTYCACEIGCKTVIFAHRHELLKQFYNTWKNLTNIKDSHIKIIKNLEDLKDPKLDVALVSYQKFLDCHDKGKISRVAKYLNDRYTLCQVDEAHSSGSFGYAKVLMKCKFRYLMGLTATPDRKDSMTTLVKQCLGPVVARGQTTSLLPLIKPVLTGVSTHCMSFVSIVKELSNSKRRKEIIWQLLRKDLEEGRQIIIPMTLTKPILAMKDFIEGKLEEVWKKEGKNLGVNITGIFNANSDRKKVLEDFDSGKLKILIAQSSMIKEGIDFKGKNVNTMYLVVPMSASSKKEIGAPMFYQMTYRICSPVKDKKQPIIRWFIDNCGLSIGCARSTFWKEICPRLHEWDKRPPRYKMEKEDQKLVDDVVSRKSYKNNI